VNFPARLERRDFVEVEAFPRLHFGLIDLAGATMRAYGGAGVAIGCPTISVNVTRSASESLSCSDVSDNTVNAVEIALKRARLSGINTAFDIQIVSSLPEHSGLGSTTATVLAVLFTLNEAEPALSRKELVLISGRGRTSGVGCQTFYSGGFAIDVGQRDHPNNGSYQPSVDSGEREPSLGIGSWQMPERWLVTLLKSADGVVHSHETERELFRRHKSVRSDVSIQMNSLYHGMLPAVLDQDIERFAESLASYQSVGFKHFEIQNQSTGTRELLSAARETGLAAGLSSLGPMVFVIHDRGVDPMKEMSVDSEVVVCKPTPIRNTGATIKCAR
jgi:beta-ribofuranosylaminobenzene 5'-phosphate synthase